MAMSNFTNNKDDDKNPNNSGTGNGGINFAAMMGQQKGDVDVMQYLINYNEKFKMAGPVLFRDEIVQQTLAVLIGKNKPNALLIGSAGVGKTKIVEDIAYRIENKDMLVPNQLYGYTIYELPLSNIVAGSSFVGQVEEKTNAIVDFMTDPANKAILFIDEIHTLVGQSETYEKIAQILKPALARGDMKVIGATTLQESSNLHKDPAFNRRFSRLIVDELSREQTIEILKNIKMGFFAHYKNKISIPDDILEVVAIIADGYSAPGSHRPDNAITLLDRTIGNAIVNRKIMEIKAQNDPVLLAAIKSVALIPITEKQIKITALKLMTGNNKKEDIDMDRLLENLSVIKGQDDVITTMIDLIRRKNLEIFELKTPLAFLFTGSSGVGKTEVSKIIAKELTGVKPITLNMTEYHSPASINRIIGSPAGYVGSDSNAELPFDCLESNPYQIILLDEFEKCDKSVQRLFMSAFEEGIIKTNKGKDIDFSKAIIIATTNAGHKVKTKTLGFCETTQTDEPKDADVVNELSKWFDAELLNRFTKIIEFNDLTKELYTEIFINQYATEIKRIRANKTRATLRDDIPSDELIAIVDKTFVASFGARPVRKAVRAYIEDQLL